MSKSLYKSLLYNCSTRPNWQSRIAIRVSPSGPAKFQNPNLAMASTEPASLTKLEVDGKVEVIDLKQDANAALAEEKRLGVWKTINQNPKVV